jgi:hypothetical protein
MTPGSDKRGRGDADRFQVWLVVCGSRTVSRSVSRFVWRHDVFPSRQLCDPSREMVNVLSFGLSSGLAMLALWNTASRIAGAAAHKLSTLVRTCHDARATEGLGTVNRYYSGRGGWDLLFSQGIQGCTGEKEKTGRRKKEERQLISRHYSPTTVIYHDRARVAGMHGPYAVAGIPSRENQRPEVAVVCVCVLPADLALADR